MHVPLEQVESLPGGLDRIAATLRRINRRLDELHLRNIARAVWKDRTRLHTHDQLRADGLGEQRIVAAYRGAAIQAQPPWPLMQVDEQQPDMRVDQEIAEALEHPVAVIVGKRDLAVAGDAHESGRPTLER